MRSRLIGGFLLLSMLAAFAGAARPRAVKLSCDPYLIPTTGSNAIITIYKCLWLGTRPSPWSKAGVFPATRTNFTVSVLPGLWYFKASATVAPWGETTNYSNIVTNNVQ